jgi:hypothetical protein
VVTQARTTRRLGGLAAARRVPEPLQVGLLCLIVILVVDAVLKHETGLNGDEPFYVRMATHPGGAHTFPYAYRVVVPWLVHALPFSQAAAFRVQAWIAIAASGGALYALLRDFAIGRRLAVALVVGFVLSPVLLIVLMREGRSIDPATTLVMTLGCLFIARRQRLALAITILIGAGVKETTLFLIPFAYAVWAERPLDGEALRDVALVSAAPIIGYVVLRTSVSAIGSQYTPGITGSFLRTRWDVLQQAFSGTEMRRLAYTYGPLWVVAPFALRDERFARRGLVLVALCVAAMTVSYDASRIIFLAAPVFYVAAASVLRDRRRLAVAVVVALFAVDVGYAVYMQTYGLKHGVENNAPRVPVY